MHKVRCTEDAAGVRRCIPRLGTSWEAGGQPPDCEVSWDSSKFDVVGGRLPWSVPYGAPERTPTSGWLYDRRIQLSNACGQAFAKGGQTGYFHKMLGIYRKSESIVG